MQFIPEKAVATGGHDGLIEQWQGFAREVLFVRYPPWESLAILRKLISGSATTGEVLCPQVLRCRDYAFIPTVTPCADSEDHLLPLGLREIISEQICAFHETDNRLLSYRRQRELVMYELSRPRLMLKLDLVPGADTATFLAVFERLYWAIFSLHYLVDKKISFTHYGLKNLSYTWMDSALGEQLKKGCHLTRQVFSLESANVQLLLSGADLPLKRCAEVLQAVIKCKGIDAFSVSCVMEEISFVHGAYKRLDIPIEEKSKYQTSLEEAIGCFGDYVPLVLISWALKRAGD